MLAPSMRPGCDLIWTMRAPATDIDHANAEPRMTPALKAVVRPHLVAVKADIAVCRIAAIPVTPPPFINAS